MTLEWPALFLAAGAAGLGIAALWFRRKQRDWGTRFNVFSILNPEGEPFPPFDGADRWWSFVPALFFGVAALGFLAVFFGIV
jgi:LPXTG-motif cell wall-anchored protein